MHSEKKPALLLTNNALFAEKGHFARKCRSSKAHYVEDKNSGDEKVFSFTQLYPR